MAKRIRNRIRRYRARPRRRRSNSAMPILPLLGLGAGLMQPAQLALSGNYMGAIAEAGARYTGYNFQTQKFDFMYALMNGWAPFLAGVAGHYAAQRFGVNRYIRKVPMIGRWISL